MQNLHKFLASVIFAEEKQPLMKKARYIAYLFMMLCTLMWVVPVVPHHHHTDGQICMKNDMHDGCRHHHDANQEGHNHGCSDKGCITTHFFQQIPASNQREVGFEQVQTIPFLASILPTDFQQSQTYHHYTHCGYIEWLHSISIQRAMGLRAPPCA